MKFDVYLTSFFLGDGFIKYMEAFKPFFLMGLKNTAEYQVCHAAVGLVGDICRGKNNWNAFSEKYNCFPIKLRYTYLFLT